MSKRAVVSMSFLFVILVCGSCSQQQYFDSSLKSIVKPHLFSVVRWESRTIPYMVKQWIFGSHTRSDNEVQVVTEYFSLVEHIKTMKYEADAISVGNKQGDLHSIEVESSLVEKQRARLETAVERIIARQVKETLAQEGIFNPIAGMKIYFPPVNFSLENPPHLLVVSPRDRIDSIREITLKQDITREQMEGMEDRVDELDVSSLVVELGGYGGTYPPFVISNASLRFTLETVVEEWTHQYLTFTPLGFKYLLDLTGISRNYEIATMNESVAGMVSREIGTRVYEKYYPQYAYSRNNDSEVKSGFDFNREMREIRKAVDMYLAEGEIERAEELLEQKRQYIVANGYYIRKLNQAYFAFHGTYADKPTSISPIGVELRKLRERSASLKEFLDTVSAMISRQDLMESVK
ncbi:hypothetical protein ACFLYL_04990 [Chloroflexota bacterium]